MPIEKLEQELEDVELAKKEEQAEEGKVPKEIFSKVVKFTMDARKSYGDLVKCVLIFGSAVKGTMTKGSDADIWVVLDDTATKSGEDLDKITTHLHLMATELKDLHVQTTNLTEFWQWIKMGSPELVNFLRYGLAVYDTGFIKPVQRMLNMGLIPPSDETIALKTKASETRLRKIKLDLKSMIFELRYTAMDSIQAVVMYHFKAQPDYKDATKYLEKLVKLKKLEKKYVDMFSELNQLWKDIDHKQIKEVKAEHLERALKITKEIIERMKKLIPKEILGEELPSEE